MPSPQTLERFIALVESNDHVQACELFYTERSTMQENQGTPRIGRDAHVASERQVMARAESVTSTCVRPVLVNGDHVVIRWVFRFAWRDGSVTRMRGQGGLRAPWPASRASPPWARICARRAGRCRNGC